MAGQPEDLQHALAMRIVAVNPSAFVARLEDFAACVEELSCFSTQAASCVPGAKKLLTALTVVKLAEMSLGAMPGENLLVRWQQLQTQLLPRVFVESLQTSMQQWQLLQ